MAFRDDNEALRAQLQVERREARDEREELLEDLEEERNKQLELQRQLEALKQPKLPKLPKQSRTKLWAGLTFVVVLGGILLGVMVLQPTEPDLRPRAPKPVVLVEAPKPDAAPEPVPGGVIAQAVFASNKMETMAETFLLAAASSAAMRSGRATWARVLHRRTKARFNKIEPGTEDVMAGVLACLTEQVTGIKPAAGQRFADATARLQGDPYAEVAETYQSIALYCQRFELAEAAAEARALAISAAAKLLETKARREQLFKLADDAVIARDRKQVRQIEALIRSIKTVAVNDRHADRAVFSEYYQQLGDSRRARALLARTPRIARVDDLTLAAQLACAHALTDRGKATRWVAHATEMRRRAPSSPVADWMLVGALLALDRSAEAKTLYADKLSSSGQWTKLVVWTGRLEQAARDKPAELSFEEYVTLAVRLAHKGKLALAKKLGQSADNAYTKHFILVLVEGIEASRRAATPPEIQEHGG